MQIGATAKSKEVKRVAGRGALGRDLRAAVIDGLAALIVAAIGFAILISRLRAGTNAAAIEMPDMVRNGGVWAYSWSQAVGWSALLWSWLTIVLGVSLPILVKQQRWRLRAKAELLHRSTSLTVLFLMLAHPILLLWDKMGDTLISDFVPYATSYVPGRFPQTLGILSLYLAIALGLSFYIRGKVGLRRWRWLHRYFVPSVYILAVWHTLAYGSDVKTHNLLWLIVWAMQAPILVAFAIRILQGGQASAQRPIGEHNTLQGDKGAG